MNMMNKCAKFHKDSPSDKKVKFNLPSAIELSETYTFSPAELSSERGGKEVLADSKQPTAPPLTKLHVSYCTARVAEERNWRPKVHQA